MPEKSTAPVQLSRPPLERMMAIHEELKRGAFTNCSKLAARLEVARKTVMRDIAFMRDRLGLPLEYDPRLHAYRYAYPVDNFPTVQITGGELLALVVARKALEQYRGTPYHAQLSAAFDKLAAGVRDRVSFTPAQEAEAISFHSTGLARSDLQVFERLSRALTEGREVEFDYRKPQSRAGERRRVRPYHLSHRENLWYLLGHDTERDGLRQFALTRIGTVTVTDRRFTRPADFSAEKYFARSFGAFAGEGDHRVRLRFDAAVAGRVRERFWHDSQEIRELADGGLELKLRLGDLAEVARWVLGWGEHVEALGPAELRRRIAATSRQVAAMHAG
jgi:proteasome accessory factor B